MRVIKYGPLTRVVMHEASWLGTDEWPSSQEWADEAERVLSHLVAHSQFGRFLGDLKGKLSQRGGAFAEARVAFWFSRNGFRITRWHPEVTKYPGDLEIQWGDTPNIFVEVKQRTWQAELEDEEREKGRTEQPRYINAEARWVDADEQVICGAFKARKKFDASRPNLVVVAENMFGSPVDNANPDYIRDVIGKPGFDGVGAVLCFDAVLFAVEREIRYRTLFIENPRAAGKPWQLPIAVAEGLRIGDWSRRRKAQ